jgi:propanol-preferring alcohol dehydrogenase
MTTVTPTPRAPARPHDDARRRRRELRRTARRLRGADSHPGPGQALVRVITSGVCHTDLHAARGDWPVAPKATSSPVTRATARSSRSATA